MKVNDIVQLLIQNRLQEALNALQPFFLDSSQWELSKEYADICNTYATLLDFFKRDVDDTERERVYTRLVGRSLLLTDKLRLKETFVQKTDFGAPSLWTAADVASARSRLHNLHESTADACLLTSDMTLSLLKMFDPQKMLLLCEAALSDKDDVSTRAVTALFLAVRLHGNRLPFYPELQARLSLLADDSAFADMLADVELQFIRSLDTERIERKLKEEIIPSMLRNPKLRSKPFITTESLTDDSDPEWKKWLSESGVEESLQELTEMQMSGADVYMATFSQLKGYPFFQKTENWFRPFDIHDDAVKGLFPESDSDSTLQQLIFRSGIFCNSDKYSFCLTLKQLPEEQLQMLRSQMKEQEDSILEEQAETLASMEKSKTDLSARTLVRQYVQDLYRFFNLHYTRSQYIRPFDTLWLQSTEQALHSAFRLEQKTILAAIELNARQKDYAYSLIEFELLTKSHPTAMDATLWQKLGYCRQKTNNLTGAVEALRIADSMKPNHYWNILHLAQCYRDLGDHESALEHFRKAESMKPDNMQLTYQSALCLIALERHDEALQLLYKIAYHEPDSVKVMRALIRTLLVLNKAQSAGKYATQMLNEHANDLIPDDWFDIGCQQWLTKNRELAISCWKQMEIKHLDAKQMKRYGFGKEDIIFIHDLCVAKIQ